MPMSTTTDAYLKSKRKHPSHLVAFVGSVPATSIGVHTLIHSIINLPSEVFLSWLLEDLGIIGGEGVFALDVCKD